MIGVDLFDEREQLAMDYACDSIFYELFVGDAGFAAFCAARAEFIAREMHRSAGLR